jgi:hypothetical protein
MSRSVSLARGLALLVVTAAAACSFDLADHPSWCERDRDCTGTRVCYRNLCVMGGSIPGGGAAGHAGSGSGGGSGGGGGNAGTNASMAGTNGGAGVSGEGAGSAGTGGTSGDSGGGAGMTGDVDASMPEAGTGGTQAPPVPMNVPYAPCKGPSDCTAFGLQCEAPLGKGFCSTSCTNDNDCPQPSTGNALPSCTSNGYCALVCFGGITCPDGLSCNTLCM